MKSSEKYIHMSLSFLFLGMVIPGITLAQIEQALPERPIAFETPQEAIPLPTKSPSNPKLDCSKGADGDPSKVQLCSIPYAGDICCYPGASCSIENGQASCNNNGCPVRGFPGNTKPCNVDGQVFCCKPNQECALNSRGQNTCVDRPRSEPPKGRCANEDDTYCPSSSSSRKGWCCDSTVPYCSNNHGGCVRQPGFSCNGSMVPPGSACCGVKKDGTGKACRPNHTCCGDKCCPPETECREGRCVDLPWS